MYATFDRHSPTNLSADVLSLSWKGDARQGWLAAGNSRKSVGVTYTEVKDWEDESWETDLFANNEVALERQGMRRNFNFREHSAEVTIVQWNKHLDKIATCDASGTVIVWRNHNGRSVMELVNNRGTPISDFKWSNDGNKVLIAYTDGYILVGTAYGRRIWARNLNLGSFVTSPTSHSQNSRLLSSTWSPDDSRIVIGSSIGELIELNATHGGMLVSTTEVLPGIGIIGLEWVMVPKEASNSASTSSSGDTTATDWEAMVGVRPGGLGGLAEGQGHLEANPDANKSRNSNNVRLSLYLRNGKVVLMNSCGDQQATIIRTGLMDGRMTWAENGAILAVAGFRKSQSISTVRFFQPTGQLMFTLSLGTKEPITAMTWAHGDQKLFIATKNLLHSITVHRGIPSLQSLCQKAVAQYLPARLQSYNLVLPLKLKVAVAEAFDPVIQGHIPQPHRLLDYISSPPPNSHRTYCTVIPNTTTAATSNHHGNHHQRRHPSSYTLYVEHLGTLIPVLVGHKRSTKIRQSFTISLPSNPQASGTAHQPQRLVLDTSERADLNESMDGILFVQSRVQRGLSLYSQEGHNSLNTESGVQLACREDDAETGSSPRHHTTSPAAATSSEPSSPRSPMAVSSSDNPHQLAEVTSNVMASKFKIQSLTETLPLDMGTILIKTSFLHIQPRKVIVCLPQLEDLDSGVDSDFSSSSDESSSDVDSPPDGLDVLLVPQEKHIESITSMEDLLLPKSIDLESQSLRPIETQSIRSHSNSCGPSFGMGRVQISGGGISGSPVSGNLSTSMTSSSSTEQHVQIHSKTPTWNEQHMIYQLDFGGRVTTKSAKNFQLELDGEQVLQFGKIDSGSFILDFQAPFSPIQAFATALANLV